MSKDTVSEGVESFTFGMLSSDFNIFMDKQSNEKKAKFVHSRVNHSVIVEDHEILILAKYPPQEFHKRRI